MQQVKDLQKRVGVYVSQYLSDFADNSMDVEGSKERFKAFYDELPTAKTTDFIKPVSEMDDLVLIDIASWFGEKFGLWIAKNNSSAKIHVYNSLETEKLDCFPDFLFNDSLKDRICKLKPNLEFNPNKRFDPGDIEENINRFYDFNGLNNVTFHRENINREGLDSYASLSYDKQLVFFSDRTPTDPEEMTSQISDVVAIYPHVDMILTTQMDTGFNSFDDDLLISGINKYYDVIKGKEDIHPSNAAENPQSRLFTAASLYYSLKSAVATGADIYKNENCNRIYREPLFIVSTIRK